MIHVIVISWNRPLLLQGTLLSLSKRMSSEDRCTVADNGSEQATRDVINDWCERDSRFEAEFLPTNKGISGAIESVIDRVKAPFVLTTDADAEYTVPFVVGEKFLTANPRFGLLSFQDSIEHVAHEDHGLYKVKRIERGGSLLFRREVLESLRPLPVHKLLDFDWWVFRDSPHHVNEVPCLRAVIHTGFNQSLWQTTPTIEPDLSTFLRIG
jgi:glycosyltransferase involved in cell wall biosynthesis